MRIGIESVRFSFRDMMHSGASGGRRGNEENRTDGFEGVGFWLAWRGGRRFG